MVTWSHVVQSQRGCENTKKTRSCFQTADTKLDVCFAIFWFIFEIWFLKATLFVLCDVIEQLAQSCSMSELYTGESGRFRNIALYL